MTVSSYSTTASSNTAINGVNISEGMSPSDVNNAIREQLKDVRSVWNDKEWFLLGDGDGTTTFTRASATSITVASDISSTYHVGRRVKVVGSNTGTIFGKIATSSYSSPNTTVTFTFDSGTINSGDTTVSVYVGSVYTNPANPVIDEDNMASDSAILPPSQQSTKAFVESGTSTLTNKTIDSANNTLTVDLSEATVTGTLAEFNTAVSDATLVSTTGTETLTNKTLTSPTVSGLALSDASMVFEGSTDDAFETTLAVADPTADRTVTLPNATTNLVGEDTTNTLTNKSISGSSNTLSNIGNSSLVNSSVSYGGVSLSLGGSDATPAFDLTDATNYPTSSLTGTITNAQLDGSIAGTKLLDDAITTAKIIDDAVTTAKIVDNAVTIDKIADSVIVTNSEQSAHTPDDSSFLTTSASDARYFRQDSTETIDSGDTWSSSDSFIATTSAIDARVIDLVDDVGGFFPIANETSFPNANPDVNDGAGTIVSIKEIATTRTPSSGTVTISSGTVGGSTVTITGCGSTVLTAGFGVLVETTTTLNTYSFHRLVPKATEVTTVASISSDITTVAGNDSNITSVAGNATNINTVAGISSNVTTVAGISSDVTTVAGDTSNISTVAGATTNINNVGNSITNVNTVAGSISNVNTVATNISDVNNFADTYSISASAPSSPTLGDLWFDTSSDTMKVYTSGGFANAGSSVNGTSDRFKYTATASQTTFSGADASGNTLAYDAGYIDVYLNGIKLVNGTDFTATNGTSIVLTSGATVNDILDIVTYGTFELSNFSINDANDVSTAGVTNGQVLAYNSTASAFQPSTIDLTNLSASNLTSGTIPDARFPATLPAISGANLTNLDASDLASGTIPDARFPAVLPAVDGSNLTGITSVGGATGVDFNDNVKARFGTSNDLEIYHDGSNSYVSDVGTGNLYLAGNNLRISNADISATYVGANNGAEVYLTYNGAKKFETTSTGVDVTGTVTADGLTVDTNTLHVDATNNRVGIVTSSPSFPLHVSGKIYGSGAVTSGGNSFELSDNNVTVKRATDDMTLSTSGTERMRINSSGDVGIGVNPTFTAGGSRKLLQVTNGSNGGQISLSNNSNESNNPRVFGNSADLGFATGASGSGVIQFYTNSTERFRIDSNGHVIPQATNTYDLGSSSNVWRNIYTSDFHMSNEGLDKGNDIDGTKGSWTFQEGEENLYLINNKNGKKYKFNLTEIE